MALPLGPYPLPGEQLPPPSTAMVEVRDHVLGLQLDTAHITGLLRPFNGRARAAALTGTCWPNGPREFDGASARFEPRPPDTRPTSSNLRTG